MSETAKVVPIARGRRQATRPKPKAAAGALEQRVHELERELHDEREAKRADSLLVALARAVSSGAGALDWASLGRLQRALYFAWHSEETDAYGADARFAERLEPFLEFLYAMWWRVEATGTEHVPARGAGLVVANHSGVLPYDGLMVQLAIKHEHPARRLCRMLALDMFAMLPMLAPLLSKSGSVRASPENAERLLREGSCWASFPKASRGSASASASATSSRASAAAASCAWRCGPERRSSRARSSAPRRSTRWWGRPTGSAARSACRTFR